MDLTGELVDVITVETQYTGVLIEMNESDVSLMTPQGWIVIPLDRVAEIRKRGEP